MENTISISRNRWSNAATNCVPSTDHATKLYSHYSVETFKESALKKHFQKKCTQRNVLLMHQAQKSMKKVNFDLNCERKLTMIWAGQ